LGTARPLECCAALLLSLCQTPLNSSKPGDFLSYLFDFSCNQIPHVRTSARFTIFDQQQLPDLAGEQNDVDLQAMVEDINRVLRFDQLCVPAWGCG
jgi:hypothetical protein